MKVKTFSYLDILKELIIFSVVIYGFYFSPQDIVNVVYWLLWLWAILVYPCMLNNDELAYTENKGYFEFYTTLFLCMVIVYFGFYILATVFFIGHVGFIGSCIKNRKKLALGD